MNVLVFFTTNSAACIWSIYVQLDFRSYSRACVSYDFLERGLQLTMKLLNPRYLVVKLKNAFGSVTRAIRSWLTCEYLCISCSLICSYCLSYFSSLFLDYDYMY